LQLNNNAMSSVFTTNAGVAVTKVERIVRCPFVPNQLEVPDVNFGSLFLEGLSDHSSSALIDAVSGESTSRGELLAKSEALAQNLFSQGVRRRDVVAVFSPNSVEWVVVLAAAFKLDAVVAGVNCMLTQDELKHQLRLCRPKVIYTVESLADIAVGALESLEDLSDTLVVVKGSHENCISLDALLVEPTSPVQLPEIRSKRNDPCVILFSSGTTGPQKAVVLSHKNIVFQYIVATHPRTAFVFQESIGFCPFSHVGGLWIVMFALAKGFTVHYMVRFDFETFLQTIQEVDNIWLIPPVATLLAKSPLVDKYKPKIRSVCCGAAPLASDVIQQLQRRFPGIRFRQLYGMTESGISTGMTERCRHLDKLGTVGVPWFNTQIKVLDIGNGDCLGPNQTGEICIKSPIVMTRYINNSKATAEALDESGWNHTGDLGYYDEDGYFYIVDRLKELIKYNAYQVAPAELEAVLLSHSEVLDAAVVGVPDALAGELPMACVVRRPTSLLSEIELLEFVHDKVAAYKKLRGGVKFVSVIPKTATGKILRRNIRASLLSGKL